MKSLVSNTFSSLKNSPNSEYILTPLEIRQRNSHMLSIVDSAIDQFLINLKKGKVKLRSSSDLERLIKVAVLLSDTLKGETSAQKTVNSDTSEASDDPTITELYEKLYQKYNQQNDID